jgi:hypothetical protein
MSSNERPKRESDLFHTEYLIHKALVLEIEQAANNLIDYRIRTDGTYDSEPAKRLMEKISETMLKIPDTKSEKEEISRNILEELKKIKKLLTDNDIPETSGVIAYINGKMLLLSLTLGETQPEPPNGSALEQ